MKKNIGWLVVAVMLGIAYAAGMYLLRHRDCRTVTMTDDNGQRFKLKVCTGSVHPEE